MPIQPTTEYKVNDVLINFGQAFKITKIDSIKVDDQQVNIAHYQSCFFGKSQQQVKCSMRLDLLETTGKRRPITKKEAIKLLRSLSQNQPNLIDIKDQSLESVLQNNNIFQTAIMVKEYWSTKHNKDLNFTITKQTDYQNGLEHLTEELAIVMKKDVKEMRNSILKQLRKQ